jgi:hypothetical protein
MPITAVLSRTLHDALGDEAAADLVDWMQQVDTHRVELRERNELSFARIDARFDAVDARFDAIDARFDAVDARFNARFDAVDARFRESDARIDARFQAADARLSDVRHELRAEIASLRTDMQVGFAGLESKIDSKIDRKHAELLKWSFLFWCGTLATVLLTRR